MNVNIENRWNFVIFAWNACDQKNVTSDYLFETIPKTLSLAMIKPDSIRPATAIPDPVLGLKTSDAAIRNGLSINLCGGFNWLIASTNEGPWYQFILLEGWVKFSPVNPETGM